jgi:uncharacterized membrane protein
MVGSLMDSYLLLKLAHVAAAILWLGGGFATFIMATIADRQNDQAGLLAIMGKTALLGDRVFLPSAIVALVSGCALVWLSWSFMEAWIVAALAGFFVSFILGAVMLKPGLDRLTAEANRDGATPSVLSQVQRLLRIVRFDFVVLISILILMVLKPSSAQPAVLAVIVVAVIAAGIVFLRPRRQAV